MTQDNRNPRIGTSAYKALQIMYDAGGSASLDDLMTTLAESNRSRSQLNLRVVESLLNRGMATQRDDRLHMLQPGYAFVRSTRPDEPEPSHQKVVQSRYIPAQREMQPGPIGVSHREGADAFRSWPSRYGDKRVPHG